MKSFSDKVAAITGAGSGIGRALALALAERGCHVAVSDIDEIGLGETVALLGASSVKVTRAHVDVAQRDEVYAWADAVAREHGRCNLVFNNAGVAYSSTIEGLEYEQLERIMDINFWGVVYGTKAFLPHLRASGEGHVINTSSLFGLIAFPGNSAYNASKFAVRGFTECLQEELAMMGAPVHATSVHPGGIKTNIARRAAIHDSVRALGADPATAHTDFERMFRTTAAEAAEQILRGVQARRRRVLVGADAKAMDALQRALPSTYQGLIALAGRFRS